MERIEIILNRDAKGRVKLSDRIIINRAIAKEMAVHIYGDIPIDLIGRRRPTESEEAFKYRLSNYQPITKTLTGRALDNIYRIFGGSGGGVITDGVLRDYLDSTDFYGQDFFTWFQKDIVKTTIADPNAWLVWMPYGEGLVNPAERVEPMPIVVNSEFQIYMDQGLIVWESEEKSDVYYGSKLRNIGEVYYAADKYNIYRIYQVGDKKDKKFAEDIYYNHNIGYVPFTELGGIRSHRIVDEENGKRLITFYESFFNSFVPFANDFINAYDDWKAIMVSSCFPIKVLESIECKKCNGRGVLVDGRGEDYSCPSCGGTGEVGMLSPFGTILKKRASFVEGEVGTNASVLDFVSPDSAIIEQSYQSWLSLFGNCEKALHLKYIDEAQSGVAKEIDREGYYSLLSLISNNNYDNIIYNSLYYADKYLNIGGESKIDIIKPVSFIVESEADILAKIKSVKESEINPFVVSELELGYIEKTAPNNELLKVRTKLYNELRQDELMKAIIEATPDGTTLDDVEKIKSNINLKTEKDEKDQKDGMGERRTKPGKSTDKSAD